MKKLTVILFIVCGLVGLYVSSYGGPGMSGGGGGGGVTTDSNCNQAKYYSIGTLCQDTDDGLLYKGIGSGVTEVTSGSGSGDMSRVTYDSDLNSKVDATAVDDLSATYLSISGTSGTYLSSVTGLLQGQINKVSSAVTTELDSTALSRLATHGAAANFSGTTKFSHVDQLGAAAVSGASLAWLTSGGTLRLLNTMTNLTTGTSSYVLTARGSGVTPIWTNVPSTSPGGSGTVNTSSAVGLAYYPAIGTGVTDFKSGTSGAILMSAGSGSTPVWGTELNISLATNQASQKNRIIYFDANGIMSGATNIGYYAGTSGATDVLDLSGVTTIIQSGTSPVGRCLVGWIYIDTDDDNFLYCTTAGEWQIANDTGGTGVDTGLLASHGAPGTTSGASIFSSYTDYLLVYTGATWDDYAVGGDASASISDGVMKFAVSGITATRTQLNSLLQASAFTGVTGFSLQARLNDHTLSISGTSLDWSVITGGVTLPKLSDVTDYVQKQINEARAAISLGGEEDATALTALELHTRAIAFTGTTGFALQSTLNNQTVASAFTGVTGFALQSNLNTHGLASSFTGVTGFSLQTALNAQTNAFSSGGSAFVRSAVTPVFINQVGSVAGVSAFLLSSVTAPYVNGVTTYIQTQLNTISGTSQIALNGTNPTIPATEGAWGIDSTARQMVAYSDSTLVVLSGATEFISVVISGVTNTDDYFVVKAPYGMTLKQVDAICEGTSSGCSDTLVFQECSSAGASCANSHTPVTVQALLTATNAVATSRTFSDGTIDNGDWIKFDVSSGTTVNNLTVTLQYWINRE